MVGASLAGLMTALALSRVGIRVTLLERSDDSGRTGRPEYPAGRTQWLGNHAHQCDQ
ncbi:FAD-dependent monooxygenase [Massilia suwonensis]|uniref:FAD-dependent monooxygenase n=1 Tax=Massilia suwonensis TaxID=648895 RepID=A0ABW0MNB7_9BURK